MEEQTTKIVCPFPPMYRYTWPGQDERFACFLHAQQLLRVAQAMGFYLQMIPLSPDEMMKGQCSHNFDEIA